MGDSPNNTAISVLRADSLIPCQITKKYEFYYESNRIFFKGVSYIFISITI